MTGELENVPSASQLGGIIPHFHYDVIGRILPGVFFLVGLAFLCFNECDIKNLELKFAPPQAEQSGSYLIFLVTLSLLALTAAGYITGSFLGSLSYFPFEKFGWLRRSIGLRDLNAAEVFKAFREGPVVDKSPARTRITEHAMRQAFRHHFGEDIDQTNPTTLNEQSRVCIYYVWMRSVSLGQMSARWDGESLVGRNILFASGLLLFLRICQMIKHFEWHTPSFAITMAVIFFSAYFMYEYERRSQISGRFSLFWAVAKNEPLVDASIEAASPE